MLRRWTSACRGCLGGIFNSIQFNSHITAVARTNQIHLQTRTCSTQGAELRSMLRSSCVCVAHTAVLNNTRVGRVSILYRRFSHFWQPRIEIASCFGHSPVNIIKHAAPRRAQAARAHELASAVAAPLRRFASEGGLRSLLMLL